MISWLATTQTRHQRVKTLLFVLCIICFFTVPVFAADTTSTAMVNFQKFLHALLSLLSRGWIVLAVLAGKLMTNQWVYGSFMHLDIYLWKIWNIMKNFANFALLGILLWEIIKGLTGKLEAKKIITKTLIAGVLIQASWFMMGALLDVSSIAMTAISSFPINFFGTDNQLTQQVAKQVGDSMRNKTYAYNFGKSLDADNIENAITTLPSEQIAPALSDDEALQSILPNESSVSGPLIFLGMSVFRFQDYMDLGNTTTEGNIIGFLLKAFVIILYSIGLALLFIANLIRIVFLRIFIILSPILVLANVFKDKLKLGDAFKNFSLSSLLWLVFRPVLFILSLSFALIVIVSFQGIMTDIQGKSLNGVQLTQTAQTSSIQVQGLSTLQISNDTLFKKTTSGVQNTFADLIIFLLSIFLVWYLIKWSITTGEGPGQKLMGNLTTFIEDTSKSLPIFGGFSANQITTLKGETTKKTLKGFGMDRDGTFGDANRKFDKKLNSFLNIYDNWDADDISSLKTTAKGGDFFAASIELGKKKNGGVSLSTSWKTALEEFLKDPKRVKASGFKGEYTKFESFFKGDGDAAYNRWRLHYLMSGGENKNEKSQRPYSDTNPPTYETLLANHYFQPAGPRTN